MNSDPTLTAQSERIQLDISGEALPADVYRPTQRGRHPAVVVATGGLGRGDLNAYRWAGEGFAARGFIALVVGFRSASPYSDIDDLRLAVEWLQGDGEADGSRLSILGHSRGGLAALRAAAEVKGLVAVISIAAPFDLSGYVKVIAGFAPGTAAGMAQFMGGEPDQIPEKYESVSALNLADRIQIPVLLMHGTADMRVPPEHSLRVESALRKAKNDRVTVEMIPGMGHFLELGTLGYQFEAVVGKAAQWLTLSGNAAVAPN
jgi:dipeptidyl aminopeptidase/acylaminoacyl peptidase